MIKNRLAIAAGVAVFAVLAGTGVGQAFWSTSATTAGTVEAGTVGISQSGFAALDKTYGTGASGRRDIATVVITNSGTVSAPFTVAFTSSTSTGLAAAVTVRTWVKPVTACSTTVPAGATTATWANVAPLTGTLAANTAMTYCLHTSLADDASVTAVAGTSLVATATVSSSIGSWTASATATAAQSAPDAASPTAPTTLTASGTSGYSTSLTWAASTDNVGVTAYDVYRGGVLVTTTTTRAYVDQTLTQGTAYTYTVRARDAAGNTSADSAAANVTTLPIVPTSWYRVIGLGSSRCVDGAGPAVGSATSLIISDCTGGTSQGWKFAKTTDGYYEIVARNAPTSVWSIASGGGTTDGARALLSPDVNGTNQQWRIEDKGSGVYAFTARSSNKCLDVQNNMVAPGTWLVQFTCNGTTAQSFRLAAN